MVDEAAPEEFSDVARISRIIGEEMGGILGCRPLAPDEDFTASGGDSLRAVELVNRLVARRHPVEGDGAERLRAALVTAVFDDASPGHLARVVAETDVPAA
ncbi:MULTISPECIES: acyl carrier protein [Streptomyces]|uniref:acyl carrier protein n=1 Tax=Streptomyces TaxID=1883 RepID=UPI0007C65723|nr:MULTISPECIES: acyl carrier protein [Streptomyces]